MRTVQTMPTTQETVQGTVQETREATIQALKSQNGLSLIEILIALSLLAVAGTFIAGQVFENLKEGQIDATKIQIANLSDRLSEFRRHCNRYPTTDQGLQALVTKPSGGRDCKRYRAGGYIKGGKIPMDPWDMDFIYESPDEGRTFVIKSAGPDQELGNEDDISSAEL